MLIGPNRGALFSKLLSVGILQSAALQKILGNLYVADTSNHAIRKVVISSGVVTTLAGTLGTAGSANGTGPTATFNSPVDLKWDSTAMALYVADAGNKLIRKVTSAGVVTTLAGITGSGSSLDGTGTAATFSGLQGMGWDGAGNLYVSDGYAVRKIVVSTAAVTTLAGVAGTKGSVDGTGTAARFTSPGEIEADGAGNVYVADSPTVRKIVASTGAVTTLAGMAAHPGLQDGPATAAPFNVPDSVALDGAGNLFVAEAANRDVRKIVLATGAVTTFVGLTGARIGVGHIGLAADAQGNVFIADTTRSVVYQVTSAGVMTTLAGSVGNSGSMDGTGTAARFASPFGLATDNLGNVYVAEQGNYTVRKIVVATGVVSTLAGMAGMGGNANGTGSAARFTAPVDIAADSAGNVYVADFCAVRKIVAATGDVTTAAGTMGTCGSTDVSERRRRSGF